MRPSSSRKVMVVWRVDGGEVDGGKVRKTNVDGCIVGMRVRRRVWRFFSPDTVVEVAMIVWIGGV